MDTSNFFTEPSLSTTYTNFQPITTSKAGFNELYRVERGGRYFVIKALKPEFRGNPLYESLLVKEAEIGFLLDNSHISRTYSLEKVEEFGNVILLEYIDGRTLDDYIAEGGHTSSDLVRIVLQLCEALSYAHKKQVVHRDIKPANIIITYNGDNVKLIDFGLSDTDSHSAFKEPAGSRKYASPEQLGGEVLDNRSDIYSLGVVIDQLYSGRTPHNISRVVSRCCRYSRGERYHNCDQVAQALVKKNWMRYAVVAAVVVLVGVVGSLVNNTVRLNDMPDPILTQDEIDNLEKYNAMAAEYYATLTGWSNALTTTSVDPLVEIVDFESDSVVFVERDRLLLDSIFVDDKARATNCYKTWQKMGAFEFEKYHSHYVEAFFYSAEDMFTRSEDELARELRASAPALVENYEPGVYGAERDRAELEYRNSVYKRKEATVLPYIISRREQLGLKPLSQEFLDYYKSKLRPIN